MVRLIKHNCFYGNEASKLWRYMKLYSPSSYKSDSAGSLE